MATNQWATLPGQNSTYGADTQNVGYRGPGGMTAGGVQWDPYWQAQSGGQNQSLLNQQNIRNGFQANPYGAFPGGGQMGGGMGGGAGSLGGAGAPGSVQGFMNAQMASNADARAQNQKNWENASGFLKGFQTPFTPGVIAAQQTQNQQQLAGQQANANRQQAGIMAADGQTDAGSLAAAAQASQRNAMGANVNATQNLGIQSTLANNKAGYDVGNSIISHLPQYRPDDYSGMAALSNTIAQQGINSQLAAQQAGGGGGNAFGSAGGGGLRGLGGGFGGGFNAKTPMGSGNWLGGGYNASQNGNQQGMAPINGLQMVAA